LASAQVMRLKVGAQILFATTTLGARIPRQVQ
jgi:hypothetical protein